MEMREVRLSRMVFATFVSILTGWQRHCGAGSWKLEAGSEHRIPAEPRYKAWMMEH